MDQRIGDEIGGLRGKRMEGGSTRWGETAIRKNEYELGKCQLLLQMHSAWCKGGNVGFARLVRAELDALADDVNELPNCK